MVGIGMDSGSLPVLLELLASLPRGLGIAAVVSPRIADAERRLLESKLRARAPMDLVAATDSVEIRPDVIYLAPANAEVRIAGGWLHLDALAASAERARPLDRMFRSLAACYGRRAAAVLFSEGQEIDGERGVAVLESSGGLALVDPPREPGSPPPPASAVADMVAAIIDHARLPERPRSPSIELAFRDLGWMRALRRAIDWLAEQGPQRTVRIWLPGCGDGFDVYLVAMLVREHLDARGYPGSARIFASDIDADRIARARTGRYTTLIRPLPARWIHRYTSMSGGAYQLSDRLRAMCVFAAHDLARQPPFSELDLIACGGRPLTSHDDTHDHVAKTLHFALRPGGYLVVPEARTNLADPTWFAAAGEPPLLYRASRSETSQPAPSAMIPPVLHDGDDRSLIEALASTNEELNSTNEQLRVSQEETWRINRELESINSELRAKVDALERLRLDLDALLSTTPIPSVFLDDKLRIVWYSPSAAEIFCLIERDVGRPLADIQPRIEGADLMAELAAALEEGVARELELVRAAAPDTGSERIFRAQLSPYRAPGGARTGVVLTFVDITEIKGAVARLSESETRHRRERDELQTVYDTAPIGLAVFDRDHRVVRANPIIADLAGLGVGEVASGLAAPLRDLLDEVFESGESQLGIPRSIDSPDHPTPRWWMCSVVPLSTAGGVVSEVSCVVQDITRRIEREKKLRAAMRHKDEFLAMLGHELRNPLAAIASANQLQCESDARDHDKANQIIGRQVTHMTRLIDDLLDLSRIVRGKLAFERQPLDLTALVETTIADRRASLPAGLELETPAMASDVWVEGDRERLTQAVDNLIGNAIKFTPAPGVIKVSLTNLGDSARVVVEDTGIGIEASLLERVFEPFQQGHNDIARQSQGLGLGLALAQKIVRLHGGELTAHSRGLGEGAAFRIELPVIEEHRAPKAPVQPRPARAPEGTLDIVLVEDNSDLADLLSAFLGRAGHHVRVAHTGAAGLAMLEDEPADVVLCDLGLPGELDGFGLARELRRRDLEPRALIAVSGYGSEDDVRAALDAGFDCHLKKPVDWDTLTRAIETRLR